MIRSPGGDTVAPDRNSPVILLGDSHNLVFQAGGDMHATGAGLADQLAYELGFAVDLVGGARVRRHAGADQPVPARPRGTRLFRQEEGHRVVLQRPRIHRKPGLAAGARGEVMKSIH